MMAVQSVWLPVLAVVVVAMVAASPSARVRGPGVDPAVKASKICVTNNAGFDLNWAAVDLINGAESADSGSYPIDQTHCLNLTNTIPNISPGDVVIPKVFADGGVSHYSESAVIFTGGDETATFVCKGTTLSYTCLLQ